MLRTSGQANSNWQKYFEQARKRVDDEFRASSSSLRSSGEKTPSKEQTRELLTPDFNISCAGEAFPVEESQKASMLENYEKLDALGLRPFFDRRTTKQDSKRALGRDSMFYAYIQKDTPKGEAQLLYSTLAADGEEGETGRAEALRKVEQEIKEIEGFGSSLGVGDSKVITEVDFVHVPGTPRLRVAANCNAKSPSQTFSGVTFRNIEKDEINEFYFVRNVRFQTKVKYTKKGEARKSYAWTFCIEDPTLKGKGDTKTFEVKNRSWVWINSTSDFEQIAATLSVKPTLESMQEQIRGLYLQYQIIQRALLDLHGEVIANAERSLKRTGIEGTTKEILACYLFQGHDEKGQEDAAQFQKCVDDTLAHDFMLKQIQDLQTRRRLNNTNTASPLDKLDVAKYTQKTKSTETAAKQETALQGTLPSIP